LRSYRRGPRVDEVKDIRDNARAIEMCARQAQNSEAEERAREIRLRAERRCGQMLTEVQRVPGRRTDLTPSPDGKRSFAEECEHNCISPKQAENWQKLAAVPEETFEQALTEPNESTAGIIMRHEVAERPPGGLVMNNQRALWLRGCVQDFEREGLLDEDPYELIAAMLDHMRTTTMDGVVRDRWDAAGVGLCRLVLPVGIKPSCPASVPR
jgi:hypothetical protein